MPFFAGFIDTFFPARKKTQCQMRIEIDFSDAISATYYYVIKMFHGVCFIIWDSSQEKEDINKRNSKKKSHEKHKYNNPAGSCSTATKCAQKNG